MVLAIRACVMSELLLELAKHDQHNQAEYRADQWPRRSGPVPAAALAAAVIQMPAAVVSPWTSRRSVSLRIVAAAQEADPGRDALDDPRQ